MKLHGILILILTVPAFVIAADPVVDWEKATSTPLKAKVLKQMEKEGIITEEIQYHSELDGEKSVDIFAYLSYPKGAKGLPAFIWNQGGLAQASPYWTELGAKRGYVALCIDFPIAGYRSTGGYPINSTLALTDDVRQAPITRGIVALLKAVTLLQSRPEVDAERIGMVGSSWGGYYTSLMVGIDPRLKVGSSMFGTGHLERGNAWWDGSGPTPGITPAVRQRWKTTLDPAWRLAQSRTPMGWFTGTNDQFYWFPSVNETYLDVKGPRHLAVIPGYNHALTPKLDDQVFVWLDIHLQNKTPFLNVTPITIDPKTRRRVTWTVTGKRKIAKAQLLISPCAGECWASRIWQTLPATIENGVCSVDVASSQSLWLMGSVIDGDGFVSSTPMFQLAGSATDRTMSWDGAAEWGRFDVHAEEWAGLHGYPLPKLGTLEKSKSRFAMIPQGTTDLPPLYFVPGKKHRLSLEARSMGNQAATLQLVGQFDGKPFLLEKKIEPHAKWTHQEWQVELPSAKAAALRMRLVTMDAGLSLRQVGLVSP